MRKRRRKHAVWDKDEFVERANKYQARLLLRRLLDLRGIPARKERAYLAGVAYELDRVGMPRTRIAEFLGYRGRPSAAVEFVDGLLDVAEKLGASPRERRPGGPRLAKGRKVVRHALHALEEMLVRRKRGEATPLSLPRKRPDSPRGPGS